MNLWKRYFFREILKVFFFFLFGFFFLYSLIEYSLHMDDFFKDHHLQIKEVILYYVNQFLRRLDFLFPMALLLSTIKVLTSLSSKNEWVVLQASGLSTRKLLGPFHTVAAICALFTFANFELFLPSALRHIDEFRIAHFHGSHLAQRRELIHLIPLKDNTKLLFQLHDKERKALFDVLWIKSIDDIWRIKYLSDDPNNPTAEYVDHIVRNAAGSFEKKESYPKIFLSDLKWHPRMARKGLIPFDQRSISQLFQLRFRMKMNPYEIPKIGTNLYFKLAVPLISPLIIFAVSPVCLFFSRNKHHFLIYSLGLFILFAFYMMLDSLTILSENDVLAPTIAIFGPFLLIATFFIGRFYKKT